MPKRMNMESSGDTTMASSTHVTELRLPEPFSSKWEPLLQILDVHCDRLVKEVEDIYAASVITRLGHVFRVGEE